MQDKKRNLKINFSYSVLQTAYIASNSILFGFAVVLLQSRSFSNTEIGLALSVSSILVIFLQPAVAAIAERFRHMPLNYFIAIIVGVTLALSLWLHSLYVPLMLVMVVFILATAIAMLPNPIIGALAMQFENTGIPVNFGIARGFGSIGYALMGYLMGWLVERFGEGAILSVYMLMLCITVVISLIHPRVPHAQTDPREFPESVKPAKAGELFSKNKTFLVFFVASVAICYIHGVLDTYQISIVQSVGGNTVDYGTVMLVMALSELPTMFLFNKLAKKFGVAALMSVAYIAFIVKACLLLAATNVEMIIAAQLCNIGTLGLYLPAIVYYTNQITEKSQTVIAQSIIGGVAVSLGRVLGNFMGGALLDAGGVAAMLASCIAITAAGFVFMRMSNRMNKQQAINQRT